MTKLIHWSTWFNIKLLKIYIFEGNISADLCNASICDYPEYDSVTVSAATIIPASNMANIITLDQSTTQYLVCTINLSKTKHSGSVTKCASITTQCAFWHQSGHRKTDLTDLQRYFALLLQPEIHLIRIIGLGLIWLIWRDGRRPGREMVGHGRRIFSSSGTNAISSSTSNAKENQVARQFNCNRSLKDRKKIKQRKRWGIAFQ